MFELLQWLEVEVPSYTWRQAGTETHTLQVFLYPSIKLHFEITVKCEKINKPNQQNFSLDLQRQLQVTFCILENVYLLPICEEEGSISRGRLSAGANPQKSNSDLDRLKWLVIASQQIKIHTMEVSSVRVHEVCNRRDVREKKLPHIDDVKPLITKDSLDLQYRNNR